MCYRFDEDIGHLFFKCKIANTLNYLVASELGKGEGGFIKTRNNTRYAYQNLGTSQ